MNKEKIENYCRIIEDEFNKFLPNQKCRYSELIDSMRYSFLLGGKRIRPIILLEFNRICNGEIDKALPFAVALEMIHTYSLIHDDLPLMDNDDMRRGKPANHIVFGDDIALLAGDGLLTEAFRVAATSTAKSESVLKSIARLSYYSGANGMVGGQVIDISNEGKLLDDEILEELNMLKTGGLLRAAATIGAIIADADEKVVELADDFGKYLGLAFQITDDILDAIGDESLLGKPVGSDQSNNKSTFVSIYGVNECKKIVDELTDKALKILDYIGGDNEFLKELTLYLSNRNH